MKTLTATATEFQRNFGEFWEQAAKRPVHITKHNRPSRVLIDEEEFLRLKRLDDREPLFIEELSKSEIKALKRAKMDRRHAHLDTLTE